MDETLPVFAHRLADMAGGIVRGYFRRPCAAEHKSDASPVTQADREAEAAMRAHIGEAFPAHGIIGEEYGEERADAEYVWVLDPIDGTRSFMAGKPLFGTLIALLHRGAPVLGIIDQPMTGERWVGIKGRPSTFNGGEIRTRACAALGDAVLATTSPYLFSPEKKLHFEFLRGRVAGDIYGGDCYAYGLLASGHLDLIVESGLKAHDVMALIPVIEGAGGVITAWDGGPVTHEGPIDLIAAGDARVHTLALCR